MKRIQIERKIKVWTTETVEYDETKYTEEEFIKLFHASEKNGINVPHYDLYETYDYEIIQHTSEEVTPEENGEEATLIIMDEEGDEIYDNHSKIYKGVRYKGLA